MIYSFLYTYYGPHIICFLVFPDIFSYNLLGNTIGFTKKEYIINSFKLDMKFMNKLPLISAFYPYAHYKEIFIRKCCGPPQGYEKKSKFEFWADTLHKLSSYWQ